MITTREIYGKFKNTLHREICKHKKQFFYSWKKLFAHSSFNDFFYQQFEFHGEIKSKNLIFLVSCSEIGHLHIFLGTKKVPRKFKKRSLFSENWKIRNDCICISEVAVVRLNIGVPYQTGLRIRVPWRGNMWSKVFEKTSFMDILGQEMLAEKDTNFLIYIQIYF